MPNRSLFLAVALLCPAVSAIAANPADLIRDLRAPALGAPAMVGLQGKTLVAEIVTPRDNLIYTFDSADAQNESLVSVHSFNTYVGDKRLQQWLVPIVLSSQPVGRDIKSYAKPPFVLTALDYSLVAEGDNAKLEVTETIAPRVAGQQALRFALDTEL